MKISIIIPFHDEEKYLIDCLDSLEEQSFCDFEVIIVLDHCKAKIEKLVSEATYHFPIQKIPLKECTGVAAARNLGIKNSKGDWIYFLDCDDYIEKDALEQLVKYDGDVICGSIYTTWYKRQTFYNNGQQLEEQTKAKNKKENYIFNVNKPYEHIINEKSGLQNVSVHSLLIRKRIIIDYDLSFNEELQYLSDYSFVVSLVEKAKEIQYCEKSLYISRRHNDPINMPSLIQTKDDFGVIMEAFHAYNESMNHLMKKSFVIDIIQKQYLRFYVKKVVNYLLKATEQEMKEICRFWVTGLKKIDSKFLQGLSRYERKIIKKSMKDIPLTIKMLKRRKVLHVLKKILTSRAKCKQYFYRKVFAKQPVLENTVLLESFFGKSYSDSPKYIYEYLNEHFSGKYNYVWILNHKKKLPYKAKQAKRFSFRYFYYLARCKYIVFNSRQPEYFIKREGNIFLETWHGTPLKKLVFDMEEVMTAAPLYKQQFFTQTRSWDYLVAQNQFSERIFRHAFMYDNTILTYGYPKNDILYRGDKEELSIKIKERLGIPQDKKVILYAPTWRDDEFYGSGQYKFSLKLDLDKIKSELGNEYIVILRTHYFIADLLDLKQYEGFAYNLSKYDDIAELYLISDILITDYSSVFFDYANLRRPMIFFVYDFQRYRDILRGFYIDMEEELPGPMLKNTEEVIECLKNIESYEEIYNEKYDIFYNKYCGLEDGNATKNIVNKVFVNE